MRMPKMPKVTTHFLNLLAHFHFNTDIRWQIHILIPVLTYLGSLNQNNIGNMFTGIACANTFCM